MLKICLYCNKEYRTRKSQLKRTKFCCKDCKIRYFKGKHLSPKSEFKKGLIPWNKGKKNPYTPEVITKMRIAKLGKKLGKMSVLHRIKHSLGALSGEKSPAWRGGVTKENEKQRKSLKYQLWRSDIFERDNYTCVACGIRGGILNADHIQSYAIFPDLRFDINNGQTLCIRCHNIKTKEDMKFITKEVRKHD